MDNQYEHAGKPLSAPIIRDILTNLQTFRSWSTVMYIRIEIEAYHLQRGGGANRLKDYHTSVYNVLEELTIIGKYEKDKEDNKNYYRHV